MRGLNIGARALLIAGSLVLVSCGEWHEPEYYEAVAKQWGKAEGIDVRSVECSDGMENIGATCKISTPAGVESYTCYANYCTIQDD